MSKYKIKRLVFSGGAMKGFAFIGAFTSLLDLNIVDYDSLEVVAGTSIGSCMALMIALKYTKEEMYSFITSFEYHRIKQWNFINFLQTWGIEQASRFEEFTRLMVKNKLNNSDPTFMELYKYYPIEMTVVATKLSTYETIYYNYKNTPNHSVIKAIRKSIAVPLLISPVFEQEIVDKESKRMVYIDGGLRDNFPIQHYPDECETVGFLLNQCTHEFHQIDHLEQQIWAIFDCIMSTQTYDKVKRCQYARIINIKVPPGVAFNPSLTQDDRQMLFDIGYQITESYFQNYLEEYEKEQQYKNDKKIGQNLIWKRLEKKLDDFSSQLENHPSELQEQFDQITKYFNTIKDTYANPKIDPKN